MSSEMITYETPEETRDKFIDSIDLEVSGIPLFNRNVQIINMTDSTKSPGKMTTIIVNRPLNKVESDSVYVSGTLSCDGSKVIYNLSDDRKSFDIDVVYTSPQGGEIDGTGQFYGEDIEDDEQKNLPCIVVAGEETDFVEDNTNQTSLTKVLFLYDFIIYSDDINNYKGSTKRERLKSAKKFVWNVAFNIFRTARGKQFDISVENLYVDGYVTNKTTEIAIAHCELKIYQK